MATGRVGILERTRLGPRRGLPAPTFLTPDSAPRYKQMIESI
jgi:hypothetical protein